MTITASDAGKRQSPININWFQASIDFTSPKLHIFGTAKKPLAISAVNDGRSATFKFKFPEGSPYITGGPLGSKNYVINNFHLHWGGSEHAFNNVKYVAELHVVHYNSKYGSFEDAATKIDGLAVLAFVYSPAQQKQDLSNLPFTRMLSFIIEPGSNYTETKNVFTYRDVIKQKGFKVASYQGSLTTPPYSESVTWLLAPFPLFINQRELRALQALKDRNGNLLLSNVRPLQKDYGRRIVIFIP